MKTLVFDLDGTLVNTIYDIGNSMNMALKFYNLKEHDLSIYPSFVGKGIIHLTSCAIGNENLNDEILYKVLNKYNEIYRQNCTNISKPYENMYKVLDVLKERGYQLAVISNKPDFETKKVIDYFFKDRFIYVAGAKENVKRKPDKEAMSNLLETLHLNIEDVYYIGDSHFDAEFAINSGCKFFLFEYGYENQEILHTYNPVAFLNNPLDLLKYM